MPPRRLRPLSRRGCVGPGAAGRPAPPGRVPRRPRRARATWPEPTAVVTCALGRVNSRPVLRDPQAHLRAQPRPGLDDQPVLLAVHLPEAGVDVAQPETVPLARTQQCPPGALRVDADAV